MEKSNSSSISNCALLRAGGVAPKQSGNKFCRPAKADRNARHYKSSLVLNCTGGNIAAGSAAAHTQALPRLANALRSLIGARSKCAYVDAADELIYYSNVVPAERTKPAGREPTIVTREGHTSPTLPNGAVDPKDIVLCRREGGSSFNASAGDREYFTQRVPSTLEQIRALYKSMPNFAHLDDEQGESEQFEHVGSGVPPLDNSRPCAVASQCPPPLQPQRKRLFLDQSSEQNCNSGSSTSSSLSAKSTPAPSTLKELSPPSSLKGTTSSSGCSSAAEDEAKKGEAKKLSLTDSGYRSRGDTPKDTRSNRAAADTGGAEGRGEEEPANNLLSALLGTPAEQPSPILLPLPFPTVANAHLPQEQSRRIASPSAKASVAITPILTRKYVWSEPKTMLHQQLPISVQSIRVELGENYSDHLVHRVAHLMSELMAGMGAELRRLSGVLAGKCTRRDISCTVMLFLPAPLAWSSLRHAAKSLEQYCRGVHNLNCRSFEERCRLRHLDAGKCWRWMLTARVSAIVDDRCALFFTAVFDFLIARLLHSLQNASNSSIRELNAELAGSNSASAKLLQFVAHSLSCSTAYHVLSPPGTAGSLAELASVLHDLPIRRLLSDDSASTSLEAALFGYALPTEFGLDEEALVTLHYFLNCSPKNDARECETAVGLEEWLRVAAIYAAHRATSGTVRQHDVLQAAHLLLPWFDCPPCSCVQFLAENWRHVFCPTTKTLLLGRSPECDSTANTAANSPPFPPLDQKMFGAEFLGWTSLCWAIALGATGIVEQMLAKETRASRAVRNDEQHIQICASIGSHALAELLLRHGSNPFKSTSLHTHSSPSAFAVSAVRGDIPMMSLFLNRCSVLRHLRRSPPADINELNNTVLTPKLEPANYAALTETEKRAFTEALHMASETERWDLALQLHAMGTPWPNAVAWMGALEWEISSGRHQEVDQLLVEFGEKMADELVTGNESGRGQKRMERLTNLVRLIQSDFHQQFQLFQLLSSPVQICAASALSMLFLHFQRGSLTQLERELCAYFPSFAPSSPPQIDPKFVDCAELSDIRFRFPDGQIVFAHRIVLINASEQFRQTLKSPSGIVEINQCSADTFRLVLEFVYGNSAKCLRELARLDTDAKIRLARTARGFGVQRLHESAERAVGSTLNLENFNDIYAFAREENSPALREDCDRFALSNLAEILKKADKRIERDEMIGRIRTQFAMALRESRI